MTPESAATVADKPDTEGLHTAPDAGRFDGVPDAGGLHTAPDAGRLHVAPDAGRLVAMLVARLGIRDDPRGAADQTRHLVNGQLDLFARHPHWPAPLNDNDLPLELSLKIEGSGRHSLRWVSDPTDYRTDLAGNWRGYLDACAAVAQCSSEEELDAVWRLCRTHLDGIPPAFPAKLVIGAGYAAPNRTRGTLYFRTGWMPDPLLTERLPRLMAATAQARRQHAGVEPIGAEVAGYDFTDGVLERCKLYTWLPVDPDRPFAATGGRHPDLDIAGALYDELAELVPPAARSRALFLQTSVRPTDDLDAARQRLFFFSYAWGWTDPQALGNLLRRLVNLGVDLEPLAEFRHTLKECGLTFRLSMVALGPGSDAPSVTFYFLPSLSPPMAARAGGQDPVAAVPNCLAAATRALLAARAADGHWADAGPGGADAGPSGGDLGNLARGESLVTAYTAAVLAGAPSGAAELATTDAWLARSLSPERELPAVAWSALALARRGLPLPDGWSGALGRAACGEAGTEISALAVESLTQASADNPVAIMELGARHVIDRQRRDGSWQAADWPDDRAATACALRAMNAVSAALPPEGHASLRQDIEFARQRARQQLAITAVPDSASGLAWWLAAWLQSGGDVRHRSVRRLLASLVRDQRADGMWRGSPTLPASGIDAAAGVDAGVLTTAIVVDALLQFLRQPSRNRGS